MRARRLLIAAAVATVLGGAGPASAGQRSVVCARANPYAARYLLTAPQVCLPWVTAGR